ncbi:MAG: flagellar basal-body rod protein FlgG [Fibrobacteria bacterium]|nr:flagellar basal-body rod protein FlgG [Fibrobacteria bacterium]
MIRSLYTGATGMKANQLYVDNIANNLANVNTTGFKKSKIEFEDLLYQTLIEPGGGHSDGARHPAGLQVGVGVKAVANLKMFTQGNMSQTGSSYDLAIAGKGFFQIMMPNGETAYTRDGSFKISADGTLVSSQGYLLDPPIIVPEGSSDVNIDDRGRVQVRMPDSDTLEELGQIEIARFINPSGLKSIGNNLYLPTAASGPADIQLPGENGFGNIESGYLETSNVQLVEEMVNMIVAQRAYEVSSKAIQTSEDMLQMANQLKR